MLPWIVVLILSLVGASTMTAQMSDRACADSLQRFSETQPEIRTASS
jgi:hypothetical protein